MSSALTDASLCHQQKVYMNINRILSVASKLMESGHYAAQHIGNVAAKLDQVSGRGKCYSSVLASSLHHRIFIDCIRLCDKSSVHWAGPHMQARYKVIIGKSFFPPQVWKEFAAGLDERSSVLALSVMFHQKAEQVCLDLLHLHFSLPSTVSFPSYCNVM